MNSTVEYIMLLGLTDYQSRAMIALFAHGEATAKRISELTRIPATKVYQVLKTLEYCGFVKMRGIAPHKYIAIVEVNELFNLLLKRKFDLFEELKKDKAKHLRAIKKIGETPRAFIAK